MSELVSESISHSVILNIEENKIFSFCQSFLEIQYSVVKLYFKETS